MVALGRALMVGTRAVLLDEPFQGLAPALALRYAEALGRLLRPLPDVAILITESNPGIAARPGGQHLRDRAGEIEPAAS
jgi:ABC-type branched-subunit amino acid transport system ATPase component